MPETWVCQPTLRWPISWLVLNKTLREVAGLCRYLNDDNSPVRGPFLGLVGMGWTPSKASQANGALILPEVTNLYADIKDVTFDEIIGFFGVWTVGA